MPIVDEKDNIIEYKDRYDRDPKDIFRITHVWIFNKKNQFLIAKRHHSKKVSPNKWSPAVVGTVEEGETYESNAKKEAEEELGLKNLDMKPLFKRYYENSNGRRFCYVFIASMDMSEGDFVLEEDEVAEVKWVGLGELAEWYKKSPEDFIPSMGQTIDLVKEYKNHANQN